MLEQALLMTVLGMTVVALVLAVNYFAILLIGLFKESEKEPELNESIKPPKIAETVKPVKQASAPKSVKSKSSSTRPAPYVAPTTPYRPAPMAASAGSAPVARAPKHHASPRIEVKENTTARTSGGGGKNDVSSPMQGTIIRLQVKEGDLVERGERVAILEAMKMENDVLATKAGTVKKILVSVGDAVKTGQALLIIES